jgi:Ca-activated chloride channel family protein
MKEHSYTKFSPAQADAVDLQSLLDQLADFLLQSGFAGGGPPSPWGDPSEDGSDRSMDALREAILQALMDSGQFTPEMLDALRGDGDDDGEAAARLAKLLDEIIQRLVNEGFLNIKAPPQLPAGHQQVTGAGGLARAASRDVQFQLTE